MQKRQELILKTIIKEYIKTALPIGSEVLVDKYGLDVSSATVRNEMAELEEAGYIAQPHTSAGRIPTEKAYDFYLVNLGERKLADNEARALEKVLTGRAEPDLKQAAKALAKISNNAIFWAFHKHDLYYTGIANLLHQPEFSQPDMIYDISGLIDRLDEIIGQIFDGLKMGPQILLGSKNPFSAHCSTVLAKYKLADNVGLVGILGPMRMNYEKNLALIKFIHSRISANWRKSN
jgi:heat-inducible transcriptional repressor